MSEISKLTLEKIVLTLVFAVIIIAAVFVAVAHYENKSKGLKSPAVLDNPFDEKEIQKRKEHLDKTFSYAQNKQKVAPEEVAKHLKISEPDAVRYLEHLVSFGKINKVNERGQKVYYQNLTK